MPQLNLISAFCICIAFTVFSLLPTAANPAGSTGKNQGTQTIWELKQRDNNLGERTIWLSKNGFRALYKKSKYAITSQAPDWQLNFFNDDRQMIYTSSIPAYTKNLGLRAQMLKASYLPDTYTTGTGEPAEIAGLKTKCVTVTRTGTNKESKVVKALYYFNDNIVPPPQMEAFFATTFGKLASRLALRIIVFNHHGRVIKLETESAKKMQVPASFFDPPKGYRRAKSEDEVTLGVDLINDIVGDLGKQLGSDGRDLPAQKK